jgi:hypothetical protein
MPQARNTRVSRVFGQGNAELPIDAPLFVVLPELVGSDVQVGEELRSAVSAESVG